MLARINLVLKSGPIWWPTLNSAHQLMDCAADVTRHVTCHVDCHITYHVNAMSVAMSLTTSIDTSSLLSTSLPSHQPRHPPRHQCMTWQLNLWRKLYYLWYLFVIENGFGLGFGGQEHSVTFSKHHGSSNLWRKFKKRHEVWSVMLDIWRYLRSS